MFILQIPTEEPAEINNNTGLTDTFEAHNTPADVNQAPEYNY